MINQVSQTILFHTTMLTFMELYFMWGMAARGHVSSGRA